MPYHYCRSILHETSHINVLTYIWCASSSIVCGYTGRILTIRLQPFTRRRKRNILATKNNKALKSKSLNATTSTASSILTSTTATHVHLINLNRFYFQTPSGMCMTSRLIDILQAPARLGQFWRSRCLSQILGSIQIYISVVQRQNPMFEKIIEVVLFLNFLNRLLTINSYADCQKFSQQDIFILRLH